MDPDSTESKTTALVPSERVDGDGEAQDSTMDEFATMIDRGSIPAILPSSEIGPEGRPSGTAVQLAGGIEEYETGPAPPSLIAQIVAEQLRAICTNAGYDSEVEIAREMRFGLRLIVIEWRDLIVAGVTIRDFFRFEAVRVVDRLYTREENVRFLAANAISMVVEDAEWAIDRVSEDNRLLSAPQQPTNITIREILAGIRTVNEEINAVLIADGSEDVEFDEELSDDEDDLIDDGETGAATTGNQGSVGASVPRPPIIPRIAPQGSSSAASNATPRKKNVRWTDEEDAVLVQVARDNRGATVPQLAVEHNRRMWTIRQNTGQRWIDDRKVEAIRGRLQLLRKTYNDI